MDGVPRLGGWRGLVEIMHARGGRGGDLHAHAFRGKHGPHEPRGALVIVCVRRRLGGERGDSRANLFQRVGRRGAPVARRDAPRDAHALPLLPRAHLVFGTQAVLPRALVIVSRTLGFILVLAGLGKNEKR